MIIVLATFGALLWQSYNLVFLVVVMKVIVSLGLERYCVTYVMIVIQISYCETSYIKVLVRYEWSIDHFQVHCGWWCS